MLRAISLALLAVALLVAPVQADTYTFTDPLEVTTTWVASASSTLNSDALDLFQLRKEAGFFGIQYQVLSAMGSVDVTKVEAHCSNDGTNYVEPEDATDFIGAMTDENWHYDDLEIPPCRYLKFVSTTGAGDTDTTITLKIYGW